MATLAALDNFNKLLVPGCMLSMVVCLVLRLRLPPICFPSTRTLYPVTLTSSLEGDSCQAKVTWPSLCPQPWGQGPWEARWSCRWWPVTWPGSRKAAGLRQLRSCPPHRRCMNKQQVSAQGCCCCCILKRQTQKNAAEPLSSEALTPSLTFGHFDL